MDHLVPVEVIGDLDIVSVTGYRDVEEWQFDKNNQPLYDADGQPRMKNLRVAVTQDVSKGAVAYLDPAETNIPALTQAGLVRLMPKKKDKGKEA